MFRFSFTIVHAELLLEMVLFLLVLLFRHAQSAYTMIPFFNKSR